MNNQISSPLNISGYMYGNIERLTNSFKFNFGKNQTTYFIVIQLSLRHEPHNMNWVNHLFLI